MTTRSGRRTPAPSSASSSCPRSPAGRASSSWRASILPICSTRSAWRIPARCGCTTTRERCRTSCRTTASGSTSATVDILRDRERGVPRYNQFRRLLHKSPVKSFEELTDVPEWAAEIKRVYDNDLEKVDTMVGLMASRCRKASASATPRFASSC